jgi:hypothetical protein
VFWTLLCRRSRKRSTAFPRSVAEPIEQRKNKRAASGAGHQDDTGEADGWTKAARMATPPRRKARGKCSRSGPPSEVRVPSNAGGARSRATLTSTKLRCAAA